MKTFAILGAGGFIGSRLTEYIVANEIAVARPIVRSFHSMARVARFDLDIRLADATDVAAVTSAIGGCEVMFHCVTGDKSVIGRSIEAAYSACCQAGVRRMIYLSSAVVHGLAPRTGTDEMSSLVKRQGHEYNDSKVQAEYRLKALQKDGAVEVVVLRPSIVFGPRSTYFTANLAYEILTGRAYLINDGCGICNTIYVDNLVELMILCSEHPRAPGNAFLTKDAERVTWRQLYTAVAEAVGADPAQIAAIDAVDILSMDPSLKRALLRVARSMRKSRFGRAAREILRAPTTAALASRLRSYLQVVDSSRSAERSDHKRIVLDSGTHFQMPGKDGSCQRWDNGEIVVDPFLAALQMCDYEFPTRKLEETLGYRPAIGFEEASRLTAEWLRFALGGLS